MKKGTLWQEILRKTDDALSSGALEPIATAYEFVEDRGVRFFVRIVSTLQKKDDHKMKQQKAAASGQDTNPFLPYEEAMFVADASDTHVVLLNKFNVVDHHILIVTREFEDQEILLTQRDFEALWACMDEYSGLGFYNGGEAAGASQRHKHLQMVPLPLAPEGPRIPVEPLIDAAEFDGDFGVVPGFPFVHILAKLDAKSAKSSLSAAEQSFAYYCTMLRRLNLEAPDQMVLKKQSSPYCLLIADRWMLLVPRIKEFSESISINSLGYAGAFLVRNQTQMGLLKEHGPMALLEEVSVPF